MSRPFATRSPSYQRSRRLFAATYKGQCNPFTPVILGYGTCGNLCWELSSGEGIRTSPSGEPAALFAVTVLEDKGGPEGQKRGDLNRAFHTREAAFAYIRDGFRKPETSDALAALIEEGDADSWENDAAIRAAATLSPSGLIEAAKNSEGLDD